MSSDPAQIRIDDETLVVAHRSATHDGLNIEIDAPPGTTVTVHINDARVTDTTAP